MSRDDDVSPALLDLLGRSVDASRSQADAGAKLAAALGKLETRLAILPAVERRLDEVGDLLTALRPLVQELADRRASEVRDQVEAARREGETAGRKAAEAEAAASIPGAIRGSTVAWLGGPSGRMARGAVLVLAVGAVVTSLARWVDLDVLRALGTLGAP